MREIGECDTKELGTLDSGDKTVAIQGYRRWPQAAKQEGDTIGKRFYAIVGNDVMSSQMLEVSLSGE